ncbi:hypothetical protein CAC42_5711 [Sphaceloma murrayae]|uniref:Vacuolar sorting protein Vps3844 C-terminal domain-containing protein n=1 Tax=Sphaceloma murrayae TaxID=2082308 RepID=A0A2K1QYY9_9PEZI|nr:hypothetical protein CAC42_5711 [Sphaceloma murrayae]
MKWSSLSFWLPALGAVAHAATNAGELYIFENDATVASRQHHTISPDAARLILASRLGVESYHDAGIILDDTLAVINDLGGSQDVFSDRDTRRRVAVMLSTSDREHFAGGDQSYTFKATIPSPPAYERSEQLFQALAKQSQQLTGQGAGNSNSFADTGILYDDGSTVVHIADAGAAGSSMISKWQDKGYDVVLLVSPAKKVASSSKYGHFTVPSSSHGKRQMREEPLEEEIKDVESPNETITPFKSNDTSPLRGILPFCYSTKEKCEATTRNCTGHGSCKLAYTQKDSAGDDEGVPCFSCSCQASVRQNKDGTKKTTVWGGPACQKKDVVAPFWVIAGVTVLMMFLVSWGVGTIWSMGEEDLPSVIGAGVSGVPRK